MSGFWYYLAKFLFQFEEFVDAFEDVLDESIRRHFKRRE